MTPCQSTDCPVLIWCLAHGPLTEQEYLFMSCPNCQKKSVVVDFTSSYDDYDPDQRPKSFTIQEPPECFSGKSVRFFEQACSKECERAMHARYEDSRANSLEAKLSAAGRISQYLWLSEEQQHLEHKILTGLGIVSMERKQ